MKMEKENEQNCGMEKLFLTSKEAAKYLGISEGYLRVCRSTGKMGHVTPPPYVLIGRAGVRYDVRALRAWAAELPTYHSVNEYPEEVSI
ncbi:hypothetical protein SDC9_113831 [bioreactor metagenome]|uniref:Helix-turn-helix domain-containing protein n=1 Tax=bioreactor metagenome TaxID=1076179 RepID=A0A645BP70_9ZZZZ|nr:helix-turn-helix domain-containing protein [Aminobacterium sp.]MEA4876535.1 helix-turn-helix domain-containing protein [Aminobacterium sp.]